MKRRGFIAAALALVPGMAILKLKPPLNGLQRDLLESRGKKRTAAVEDFEQAITEPVYGHGPAWAALEDQRKLEALRAGPFDSPGWNAHYARKFDDIIMAAYRKDRGLS